MLVFQLKERKKNHSLRKVKIMFYEIQSFILFENYLNYTLK
jgi:hypothetical protein